MNREALDKLCERLIVALVFAIVAFAALALGAVRSSEFVIVQGLTVCAAVVWLLRLFIDPRPRFLAPPLCWAVLLFVLYAIVRYCMAEVEFIARNELIRIIVYGLLFFIVLNNVRRPESVQAVALGLVGVGVAISGYAIYQFATHTLKVWDFTKPIQYSSRAGGTFINPNHLGGFLELLMPVGFAYVLIGRFSHLTKILLGYASFVILAGIVVTLSRGAWMATGVMLLFFFTWLLRYREFRVQSGAMLAVLLIAGTFFFLNTTWSKRRIDQGFRTGELEDSRIYFWQAGIKMWKDHPWFGVGPGHFDSFYGQYRQPLWRDQMRPIYAHNDYVNTLADWGAVGGVIIVAALVLLAMGAVKTWPSVYKAVELGSKRSSSGSNRAALLYGAAMGIFALLIHEAVEFNLQIPAIALATVTLMALITGLRRNEDAAFSIQVKAAHKLSTAVLTGAAIVFLVWQGVPAAKEAYWLRRAGREGQSQADKLVALKNALSAEPRNAETAYKIGELLRLQSWEGNDNYRQLAEQALTWFLRGAEANPRNAYNFLRAGMCLDWIGKHEEAASLFDKALQRDPNNFYLVALEGWHFVQVENYVEAKKWFERSLQLYDNYNNRNPMPLAYLDVVNRKLAEATNSVTATK